MNTTDSSVLQVTGLAAKYGKVTAVAGANIKVARGSIVTVIGGNGAGKSTLLNSIMGSLPLTGHCAGSIQYLGSDVASWQVERRVAGGMSLVPERRELFGSMSVEDNLLLGGFRLYRAGKAGWKAKIEEVYDLFPRLRERKAQEAGTLSGGERQMLAVGRALMAQPQLLMLDEPSLGLAPRIVREIFQIISRLRSGGVSILLVEQNARAALQVADYGYVLETGEIVLEGPAGDLIGNPRVIESYLGLGNAKKAAGEAA
ncbi:ABC transporter ATP-binding protein [Paralcaligenes sp. KSB-10]|jgi:branched-chain amino acid transport system ATP-binding protein|uniref:ABC transporter ATP-binding protein n=1 Tax=Paralcaligenes sp. KSB-10 TaxID=2901142 RepID=UPI001E2EF57B|nr:ABC transporter ATP-binding protein [Paralcaligenes sp. KSB-10]UHL66085.1 ABC transporter ATP-binding protein [Paralcaligenes sp. KSB-10]